MVEQGTGGADAGGGSLFKSLLGGNAKMKKILEDNPELEHMIKDPKVMQDVSHVGATRRRTRPRCARTQAMRMMSNPAYQLEMTRNQDRALSNIEMLPEGFNALRRAYASVQEPLFEAMDDNMKTTLRETQLLQDSGATATRSAAP